MQRMIRIATTRPKLVIALWVAGIALLGVNGIGVESKLKPADIYVPGTEPARANELAQGHFGQQLVVLLRGPRKVLDRQGPELADALAKERNMRVLSAWDGEQEGKRLRPKRNAALITIDADPEPGKPAFEVAEQVRHHMDEHVKPPVRAHVTGAPAIALGLNESVTKSTRTAEIISFPILIIVLLLVFRSPLAAAIPIVVGFGTVIAGFGVLGLFAGVRDVDTIALSLASMVGLALGVDYSLLLVSRFREARRDDESLSSAEAARVAGATAGRTALFAGCVLIVVMAVPLLLSPGSILFSAALGAIVVAVLGVVGSLAMTPAVLTAFGDHLERWPIPLPKRFSGRKSAPGGGALARRPLLIALPILLLLLALSLPALRLSAQPPNVAQLPDSSLVRKDYETVTKVAGPGWAATMPVAVSVQAGTLADPDRLDALDGFQQRAERLKGVDLVVGPGTAAAAQRQLKRISIRLGEAAPKVRQGTRGIRKLDLGVGKASDGVQQVVAGLDVAAEGAGRLAQGTEAGVSGAMQLARGISMAREGGVRLSTGLTTLANGSKQLLSGTSRARDGATKLSKGGSTAQSGARELADGAGQLRGGAQQLADGAATLQKALSTGADELQRLHEPAKVAETELRAAFDALTKMTVGKADPQYVPATTATGKALAAATGVNPLTGQRVQDGYDGLAASVNKAVAGAREAAAGAGKLADGARQLADGTARGEQGASALAAGLTKLQSGQRELAKGLGKLHGGVEEGTGATRKAAKGGKQLADGLKRLDEGGKELEQGAGQLSQGAGELSQGLRDGGQRSQPLAKGMKRIERGVSRLEREVDRQNPEQLQQLQRRSPNALENGFATLAAVSGSSPLNRKRARFVLDHETGAQVGRILVVPTTSVEDPKTERLVDELKPLTRKAESVGGVAAAVGGIPAANAEYIRQTQSRLPWMVLGIALLTFVGLVPILRALLLPAIAVFLNLLTVAVAFGVMALVFVGDDPLLGGTGSIDAVAIAGIFAITFALSIDYEVFLLTRMREQFDATGSNEEAITRGLAHTAPIVTGAAAIMLGVFCAFALAEFTTIRQFGVGLAVAVLVDATVVRLVLLPALMRLFGDRVWAMPRWLDRIVPRVDVEATEA